MTNRIRTNDMPARPNIIKDLWRYSEECNVGDCSKLAHPEVGIALCADHLRLAYAAYLTLEDEGPDRGPAEHHDVRSDTAKGYVYFARIGEIIKIGWSHNPPERLRNLQVDAILHTQPGTRQDEKAMHGLFHHLLDHGREWFKAEPELLDYIKSLHTQAA